MITAAAVRSPDGTAAVVKWTRLPHLTSYQILKREKGVTSWTSHGTRSGTTSYITISGLTPSKSYEFMVRGREDSSVLSSSPIVAPPNAEDIRFVTALNAVDIFPDRIVDPFLMSLAAKRAKEIITTPSHRPLVELTGTDHGEVLAWNSWWGDPVQGFIKSWAVNSATHRALMSNPNYKYIGAAWVRYGEAQAAGCAIVKVTPA